MNTLRHVRLSNEYYCSLQWYGRQQSAWNKSFVDFSTLNYICDLLLTRCCIRQGKKELRVMSDFDAGRKAAA